MQFFRMIDQNTGEDFWVCEDCHQREADRIGDTIDADADEYGDHECQICGLYFDDEEDAYNIIS